MTESDTPSEIQSDIPRIAYPDVRNRDYQVGKMDIDMELGTLWPLVVTVLVSILCILFLWARAVAYRKKRSLRAELAGIEGFANPNPSPGSGSTGVDQRMDDSCYDAFYARVYDHLVQPIARAPLETQVSLEVLTKTGKPVGDIRVADIGSGTGLHVELFAKQGVRSVIGYDKSTEMITESKRRFPERDFIVGDATVATMATADQFDLVTLNYFTVYMVPDRTQMLKNIFLWLAPGGALVCHIVNKLKFDPVLESASPFVGFSVQKYADNRVTKSQVFFEEFEYEGDFQLHGSRGSYVEEFQFKDGRSRRHEQRVWMPNIDVLVAEIGAVGFKYETHVDLTPIGYEYQYLFVFRK